MKHTIIPIVFIIIILLLNQSTELEEICGGIGGSGNLTANEICSSSSSLPSIPTNLETMNDSIEDCTPCFPPIVEMGERKCPNDSHLVMIASTTHNQQQQSNCCESTTSTNNGVCICNPCQKPSCPHNQSVQIIAFGTKRPGTCCDEFQCLKPDSEFCTLDGSNHKDKETWSPDKCSTCHCDKGLVYCSREECVPPAGCGYMYTPQDECCPVCEGCVSENRFFSQNQTWFEADGCFKCSCEQGRARCIAEYCVRPACQNPIKLKDVCCPVCLETGDFSDPTSNRTCPAHQYSCSKACEFGYVSDTRGCNLCECGRLRCQPNSCEHGHAVQDFANRRTCDCRPSENCDFLKSCDKLCPFGFRLDQRGCPQCECRSPAPKKVEDSCRLDCGQNGFVVDTVEGRELCECADDSTSLALLSTCRSNAKTYSSGEVYFDGCRQCFCFNGIERCALLSCPALSCPAPIWTTKHDCCPSCPPQIDQPFVGRRPIVISTNAAELCRKQSGTFLPDGELISIDNCTSCLCLMGVAFCDVAICPPVQCSSSTQQIRIGSCCTTCNETSRAAAAAAIPATELGGISQEMCIHQGNTYADGDVWKPDACQSCTCKKGTSYCFPEICPQANCANPVFKKGSCCPFCLEGAKMSVCVFNGQAYQNGDNWKVGDCSQCECKDGQIICTKTICPNINCAKSVILPGKCCSICIDNITTETALIISNREDPSALSHHKMGTVNLIVVHSILIGAIILLVSVIVVLIYLILKRGNLFIFQQRINNATFGPPTTHSASPDNNSFVTPETSDYRYIKYYIIGGGSSKTVGGATVGIAQRASLLGDLTDSVIQLGSDMALSSWDDCTCSDSRLRSNQDLAGSTLTSPQQFMPTTDNNGNNNKNCPTNNNPTVIYV